VLAPKLLPKRPKLFPANATLPPPRFAKVQDRGNSRQSWKFFEYWKELAGTVSAPTEQADLVEVRFYMHWPVISLKLVEPNRTTTEFETFAGPLWFEDPEDYLEECEKKLGSGGWHVVLNEANVHGHLAEAYFSAIDLDKYPVKIDLRTLVRGDAKNTDYLRWLGVNGVRTPWENLEGEDDMQTGDVLKVVVDGMRETNQLVREKTEELAEVKLAAVEEELERTREEKDADEGKRANAETESVRLIGDVARDMVKMAREDRKPGVDVIEVLKTAVDLVRPKQDTGLSVFIEAMKDQNEKMLKMQESNQEFMRSVIGMRKNQDGTWADAQQPQGGFEAEITRFQRMADILGFRKPGMEMQRREEPERPYREPEKSIWAAIAENPVPVVTMITTGITLIANLVYNWRAEPGKAVSPQEALQKVQPQQQQQQQPQQQQRANPKDPASWLGFAQQILPSFKAHFHGQDSGLSGFTFAEFILRNGVDGGSPTPEGRRSYNSIVENLGPKGFDQVIKNHPPLLEVVKDTPQQYAQFLADFFGYDQMMEKQQQAEGAQVA
jgi:hypothetical protein